MVMSVSCDPQDCRHHGHHLHMAVSRLTYTLGGHARKTGAEKLACPSPPLACRIHQKRATPMLARSPAALSASRIRCVRAGCVHSEVLEPACRDGRRWLPCTLNPSRSQPNGERNRGSVTLAKSDCHNGLHFLHPHNLQGPLTWHSMVCFLQAAAG